MTIWSDITKTYFIDYITVLSSSYMRYQKFCGFLCIVSQTTSSTAEKKLMDNSFKPIFASYYDLFWSTAYI